MGESELEWMAVTSSGVSLHFFWFLWGGERQLTEVQPVRNVHLPQLSTLIILFGFLLFSVTSFAGVAPLPATSCDAAASKVASRSKTKAAKSLQPSCVLLISGEGQL